MSDRNRDPEDVQPALPHPFPDRSRFAAGGAWGVARVVCGVLLVIVGLLGCILPVIPGIPILIAGVALLGRENPIVRPFAEWLDRWRNR